MLWAVARRAVLVTNLNLGDQLGAYQVPGGWIDRDRER